MASLVLGVAGSALGGAVLGGSVLGGLLTGAQVGGALGALAGTAIDAALTPGRTVNRTGPRLSDINITASTEGAPIPRLYGRMRVAGQLIWATRFKETATTTSTKVGGKGAATTVRETDYSYSISFAVGLCEGVATRLGRVWANGTLLDLSQYTYRFYRGTADQPVDPLIAETEGAGASPAYRGLCHVVFEDMPLADFGNRIPQLQFEVFRGLSADNPAALESLLTGVALIPGAGEFVYADEPVFSDDGDGASTAQNVHTAAGVPDLDASLDDLIAQAPNMGAVSLVVGWFGDDLRAGSISVRPGVEEDVRTTYPQSWSVNGVARADAHLVSRRDGRPAYGGTPSDASVVQAIARLKARGLRVLFNPFLFLDIAPGNALPDPSTGAIGQAPYPWRGRITCPSADDKTGAAAVAATHFFGAAAIGDFAVSGTAVSWTGGTDWGWRRMVLHYAHLCAAAGGVDAFLIGSELRGLTRMRANASTYPAVAALKTLAADVKAILPGARVGYGADWSEYNNHQTGDAAGAVLFNLDPLWADPHIDFIGIDNYLPLADWRDGDAHLDRALAASIYDPAYLSGNIKGGEDYDWYYASADDRAAQIRTAITDGAGKPWVWRAKDLWGWWGNTHYDRPDGAERATPTAWVPGSKPIWFTELGCPAIDKGANQPNVFTDPKSSESAAPYFSSGTRDDLIQRRFLEAHLNFWRNAANNAGMVDADNIYAWCWDARPFPEFPARADVWGDANNYTLGHWLNGRLGSVTLADLVAALCQEAGFAQYDVSGLTGMVTGFAVTDAMSARDAIAPLASAYFFDAVESQGVLRFVMRGRGAALALSDEALVLAGEAVAGSSFTRAQDSDLPQASRISFIDADQDYRQASVEARRPGGASNRVATSSLPLVMDQAQAAGIGARLLQDAWVMRDSASLTLPPSALALEAADEVLLDGQRLRITGIDDSAARAVTAVATDPTLYDVFAGPAAPPSVSQSLTVPGRARLFILDLPLLQSGQPAGAPLAGAFADPWPGAVAVARSASSDGFVLDTTITQPCSFGVTVNDFWSGPPWHWDRINTLTVRLTHGALVSADAGALLTGANALAVQNGDGGWEVVQFVNATLIAPGTYALTQLKRGRRGTERQMRSPVAAGAAVVVLDSALVPLGLSQAQARLPWNWRWGPAGRAISDVSWQGASQQLEAVSLIPPAPCHVGFQWSGGDLVIGWRRRDRDPLASSLSPAVTPMSEAREAYDLEIVSGSAVVRSFSGVGQHSQTYTAAQMAADFPSGLPNPLTVQVYQLSSLLGRGRMRKEMLYVR